MILEMAILDVKPGQEVEFEHAFSQAQKIISKMEGYLSHQLQRNLEKSQRYVLFVNWEKVEHHTKGFRDSPEYQKWRELLHHFYEPFPEVEHYAVVFENAV